MEFSLLNDLLGLSEETNKNPKRVAQSLGCNYESDPDLFKQLAEITQVLQGQIPFEAAQFNPDKPKRVRTQFSFEDQVLLYHEFERSQQIDGAVIKSLAKQTRKSQDEIKQWWYNRRSDVRECKYKIPDAIQKLIKKKE